MVGEVPGELIFLYKSDDVRSVLKRRPFMSERRGTKKSGTYSGASFEPEQAQPVTRLHERHGIFFVIVSGSSSASYRGSWGRRLHIGVVSLLAISIRKRQDRRWTF